MLALAGLFTLLPFFLAAFWPRGVLLARQLPLRLRLLAPAFLGVPYLLVSLSTGLFSWSWLSLYTLLPLSINLLLYGASLADPEQNGDWRDFLILALLGLAVCSWMPVSTAFSSSGS
jgi:hypothetical protein